MFNRRNRDYSHTKVGKENIIKNNDYKNMRVIVSKSLNWVKKIINQNKIEISSHVKNVLTTVMNELSTLKQDLQKNEIRNTSINHLDGIRIELDKVVENNGVIILNQEQRKRDDVTIDYDSSLKAVRDSMVKCHDYYARQF